MQQDDNKVYNYKVVQLVKKSICFSSNVRTYDWVPCSLLCKLDSPAPVVQLVQAKCVLYMCTH